MAKKYSSINFHVDELLWDEMAPVTAMRMNVLMKKSILFGII